MVGLESDAELSRVSVSVCASLLVCVRVCVVRFNCPKRFVCLCLLLHVYLRLSLVRVCVRVCLCWCMYMSAQLLRVCVCVVDMCSRIIVRLSTWVCSFIGSVRAARRRKARGQVC